MWIFKNTLGKSKKKLHHVIVCCLKQRFAQQKQPGIGDLVVFLPIKQGDLRELFIV